MIQGIALENFTLLELSRTVSGKGNLVLYAERNVTKKFPSGKFETAWFYLRFLLYILRSTLLSWFILSAVHYTCAALASVFGLQGVDELISIFFVTKLTSIFLSLEFVFIRLAQ